MPHTSQERYSKMAMAKLRSENVLKDGVVFNTDYEGNPVSGAVKIPVRDTEVAVSDYDKANGITATSGSTSYTTLTIDKDKAVNEVIDGYDAQSVPDNLVADRIDSAGYSLANQIDTDGGTTLLAGATVTNVTQLTESNIYDTIVDIRTDMSKAKIPNDGKRYLLVTPDTFALILKCDEFVRASALGDAVVQNSIVGKIAGFNVIEWNDTTANLAMVAGHPRFATRVNEWSVGVHVQDLSGSGKYIGASAVQGRMVYAHKVLRSAAVRAAYTPGSLTVSLAAGSTTSGTTVPTVSAGNTGTTYSYKVNPSSRATYNMTSTAYAGTSLTSGTTEIAVSAGDVIEIVNLSSSKVVAVAYVTVPGSAIKA
ncbi:MAG: hypothetical protein Q4F95_00840 [Oscillospiraceae bacterium]|nr:hypothetical protein [Oscillospiraceae bacterium]